MTLMLKTYLKIYFITISLFFKKNTNKSSASISLVSSFHVSNLVSLRILGGRRQYDAILLDRDINEFGVVKNIHIQNKFKEFDCKISFQMKK